MTEAPSAAPDPQRPGQHLPALLCVTRHGETDWNVTGVLQGWIDVPLNDRGREQARDMARTLAAFGFAAVVTSPLSRSAETAAIIAAAWGLPAPEVYYELKERHFGVIQGVPKNELAVTHPGLHEQIIRRNPACRFDGGEGIDHFVDRVFDGLCMIARDYPGRRVLVITHGWVMDAITRQIRDLPRRAILPMKRRNGESVWIEVTPGPRLREIPPPTVTAPAADPPR